MKVWYVRNLSLSDLQFSRFLFNSVMSFNIFGIFISVFSFSISAFSLSKSSRFFTSDLRWELSWFSCHCLMVRSCRGVSQADRSGMGAGMYLYLWFAFVFYSLWSLFCPYKQTHCVLFAG